MSEQQVDSTAASNQASESISTFNSVGEQRSDSNIDDLGEEQVYLRLVSAEGEEFRVKREHALISGTISAILSGPAPGFEETDVIYLHDMSSRLVQKVCKYFEYRASLLQWSNSPPEFLIEPDIALEMTMASTYLDC